MKIKLFFLALLYCQIGFSQNEAPVITNLVALPDYPNQSLTLTFDLDDAENDDVSIMLLASDDGGQTFEVNTTSATGDIGFPVTPGTGKSITWPLPDISVPYSIRLIADDMLPLDIQAIVDAVDSTRLWDDLGTLEGIRHRTTGNDLLESTRLLLEQTFSDYNLDVITQDVPLDNYTGKNIIGTLPGKVQPNQVYIIDGHYDTVSDAPGADDNGTAVAGVLEAVRILSGYHFENTIQFIGFDLEEEGLAGSIAFASGGIPSNVTIGGVVNMEMIGYYDDTPNSQQFPSGFELIFPDVQAALEADSFRGNFITNVSLEAFNDLGIAFHNAADTYVPELKVIDIVNPNGFPIPDLLRSDHAPFWTSNRPAIMLTDGADFRNPYYHTSQDVRDVLDKPFFTNVVKAAVATIAELAVPRHCTIAEVDILASTEELNCATQVFPNPAKEWIQLSFGECVTEQLQVLIYDTNGALITTTDINPEPNRLQKIPSARLQPGVYFIKIGDGTSFISQKIIVL